MHTRGENLLIRKGDIYLNGVQLEKVQNLSTRGRRSERQLLADFSHRITTATSAIVKLKQVWGSRSISFATQPLLTKRLVTVKERI